MKLSSLFIVIPLALFLDFLSVDGRLYCFRRLKRKNKCGGYLRRHHNKLTTPEACCAKKGQGFADKKIKVGRNRYRCTPCSTVIANPFGNQQTLLLGDSSSSNDQKTTTTTTATTTTTTEFFWPAPARREYSIDPSFPLPKDDDGKIIQWEEWSPCSVSCGAGWRSRAKVCDNCDRNDYDNVQSQPCMVNFYCPVDGNWGPWYPWDSCSTTCNGGTRKRQRKCNYPPPAYGGAQCPGDAVAFKDCNKKPCPVDGNWGEWSDFSQCSRTCGPGNTRRTRNCDSPLPEFGGRDCQGPDSYTKKCELVRCPVDGGWSLWSHWSRCSSTCGPGLRERRRSCDSPRPQHGGEDCEGDSRHQEECYGGRPCPVDGGWSSWTNYGYCRAPRCSRGYQIRSRTCSDPIPAHGGAPCLGQQYERIACYNDHDCPRNGSWCAWSDWNSCSSSCKEEGSLQGRQRICSCPAPKNGGLECQGDSFQVQECKDLPVCNTPEQTDISGDGAIYDEEADTEARTDHNTDKPMATEFNSNERIEGMDGMQTEKEDSTTATSV